MDVSSHTTLLPAGAAVPEWVQLLPAGEFFGIDGRGPYRVRNPKAVIEASMVAGKLPVDENHSTQRAPALGQPAPARGWVVELDARADGVWGKIDWNDVGHAMMTRKEYRGISPVFAHEKDGTVTRLISAALTNSPNLKQLASLNTRLTAEERRNLKPEDFAVPAKRALPISDAHHVMLAWGEVDDTQGLTSAEKAAAKSRILARAKKLGIDTSGWTAHTTTETGAEMDTAKVAAALGLGADADEAAILVAITARETTIAAHSAELTSLKTTSAPVSQVVALQTQITTLENERKTEKAETFVDAAIAAGYALVPVRTQIIAMHVADPAKAKEFVDGLASVNAGGTGGRTAAHSATDDDGISEMDAKIYAKMGISRVDAAKALKAKAKEGSAA